jgi:predicted PolB exonuclease-like 3'-5' exonuclease
MPLLQGIHHKENKLLYWNYTDTHYSNTQKRNINPVKSSFEKTQSVKLEIPHLGKEVLNLQANITAPEEKLKNDQCRTQ